MKFLYLIASSLLWASLAQASPYLETSLYAVNAGDNFKTGSGLSLTAGYQINNKARVGLEIQSNQFDSDGGDFNVDAATTTILLNYQRRFYTQNTFHLGWTAGVGVSATEYNLTPAETDEDGLFTLQVGVTGRYDFANNYYLAGSARLQRFDDFDEQSGVTLDNIGTAFYLGASLGYTF